MGINNRTSIAIAIPDYMCMHVDCLVQFTAQISLSYVSSGPFCTFPGGGHKCWLLRANSQRAQHRNHITSTK